MPTRGELENAICLAMKDFQRRQMGQGPTQVRTHLLDDVAIVRSTGILGPAERVLKESGNGNILTIRQLHRELLDTSRLHLASLVEAIVQVPVSSILGDVCVETDECLVIFRLERKPAFVPVKRRSAR